MSEARERAVQAFLKLGTVSAAARELGIARSTIYQHLKNAGVDKPVAQGSTKGMVREERAELPKEGIRRYLLTSAQNNTHVNAKFWENLLVFTKHIDAELKVSRTTYNINAYTSQPTKPDSNTSSPDKELWYDPSIIPHLDDRRVELAPGLVWCGETNILPTAARPLTGFETYTGRRSGIFPHSKIAMESIASGKREATKFNYTTGTVTLKNYLQRKAGQKAEHHHTYGALLVEVDSRGRWYCRQINATDNGEFYDLDLRVKDKKITRGHRAEAINWGDVHTEQLDAEVRSLAWAKGGMLDTLKPKYQFMHDTVSFARRNHHDRSNPHIRFQQFIEERECVRTELEAVRDFLNKESYRKWCQTIVVDSNHDNAMERWLREVDYRSDPINALWFLTCQKRKYESISSRDPKFHLIEWSLRKLGAKENIEFLHQDEPFVICPSSHGGIECGMHGDLGPDGARGSPVALSRMGRKANTGHTHKAGITDGLYTAGTSSNLDLVYNKGPSSWSHSHIVTYPNGKRAIITMWHGAWRGEANA